MAIDLQGILREHAPRLVEHARQVLAAKPNAHPVALILDAASALSTALATEGEIGSATAPDGPGFVGLIERADLVRLLGDQRHLTEWLQPAGEPPRELVFVVCKDGEMAFGSAPLAARAKLDRWQRFSEQEQSFSLIEKHSARIAREARSWWQRHQGRPAPGARGVVGFVLAPELVASIQLRDQHGVQAMHVEPTGEGVYLLRRRDAEALLREWSPDLLDWLRSTEEVERRAVAVICATHHGFRGAVRWIGEEDAS
jgi:hypothetical protein